MTDLERVVQDALSKYFGPNTSTGGLRRVLKKVLDAHLKEDAEREAKLRTFMSEDYAAQASALTEMLKDREAELAELRKAVRRLREVDADPHSTPKDNEWAWNALMRLIEEKP